MLVVNKTLDSSTENIIFKTIDLYKNLTLEEFSLLNEDIHLILDSPYKVNFIRTCSGDSYFKDNEYFLNISKPFIKDSSIKDKITFPGNIFGGLFLCKKGINQKEVFIRESSFKISMTLLDFLAEKGIDKRSITINGFGELFIQNKKILSIDNIIKRISSKKSDDDTTIYIVFYNIICNRLFKDKYDKELQQHSRFNEYGFISDFVPGIDCLEIKTLFSKINF